MPEENRKEERPIEFICEEDREEAGRLVCHQKEEGEERKEAEEEEKAIPEKTIIEEKKAWPEVIIGAINIGTRPVKEFFRSRHERFYHPLRPGGRWHLVIDIFLLAMAIGLATFNLALFYKTHQFSELEPMIEFKAELKPSEIGLGEKAVLSLSYLNAKNEKIKEARFRLKNLGGLKVVSVEGGKWDYLNSTLELGEVLPWESGKIEIVLEGAKVGKSEILIWFEYLAKKGKIKKEVRHFSLAVSSPVLKIEAYARYWSAEGEQLGRGPLPPKVGQTTKYQIFWLLKRTVVPLTEVVVEGELGDNVSWTGFVPLQTGNVYFDSLTRKIIWKVGRLESQEETMSETKGIVFEVALKPDLSQVGKEADLIKEIKGWGKETITGNLVKGEAPKITTRLINDSKASGKSLVVE
jgi:hypothetical protein